LWVGLQIPGLLARRARAFDKLGAGSGAAGWGRGCVAVLLSGVRVEMGIVDGAVNLEPVRAST